MSKKWFTKFTLPKKTMTSKMTFTKLSKMGAVSAKPTAGTPAAGSCFKNANNLLVKDYGKNEFDFDAAEFLGDEDEFNGFDFNNVVQNDDTTQFYFKCSELGTKDTKFCQARAQTPGSCCPDGIVDDLKFAVRKGAKTFTIKFSCDDTTGLSITEFKLSGGPDGTKHLINKLKWDKPAIGVSGGKGDPELETAPLGALGSGDGGGGPLGGGRRRLLSGASADC